MVLALWLSSLAVENLFFEPSFHALAQIGNFLDGKAEKKSMFSEFYAVAKLVAEDMSQPGVS